jgi:uncharacterized membrane protein
MDQPGSLVLFFGRFHPVLLHFPIVLVLLTLIFEGLNVYQKLSNGKFQRLSNISYLVGPLLLIAVISSLITVIGGYLLFQSGEYQGELVQQHLWGGVLLIISLNSAALFYFWPNSQSNRNIQAPYQGFLFLAGALVIITSHLGGSITHGDGFLTEHLPSLGTDEPAPVEKKQPEDLLIFEDLILPILEDKCQSCHNQYKIKGGLILTSFASIQKGGDSEKSLITAQDPFQSELFHRLILPMKDDERMPPSEKPQLEQYEIDLIEWWIQNGGNDTLKLGMNPSDTITILLDQYLPNLYQSERLKMRQQEEIDELSEELAELGEDLGLVIEPDPEFSGFFTVSMQIPPAAVTNYTLTKLKPYATLFSKVSLPGADIDDEALFEIGKMINLRNLIIPKTCVKGDGLIYLKNLLLLENINLSNSELSNEGILNLIHLPAVKTIFVWGAETDTVLLKAMRAHLPDKEILEEEGTYF